jgi:hypothetical protein
LGFQIFYQKMSKAGFQAIAGIEFLVVYHHATFPDFHATAT